MSEVDKAAVDWVKSKIGIGRDGIIVNATDANVENAAHDGFLAGAAWERGNFTKRIHPSGTDGCIKCDTGRVTIWKIVEECIECRAKDSATVLHDPVKWQSDICECAKCEERRQSDGEHSDG